MAKKSGDDDAPKKLSTYTAKLAEFDAGAKTIKVERLLEEGRQVVTAKLPAVIGTVKEINEPRYPSFMGIKKAAKVAIPTWGAAEAGYDAAKVGAAASPTKWLNIAPPPAREGAVELLAGSPAEAAAVLAEKLIAEKVI